jgi:VIT1/CCC1 family predicted Fe2+/Mn2+ transporter
MTKWARMRKRKERKRAEEVLERSEAEGKEAKLAEPENIQHSQKIEKLEDTKTSSTNTILSQIPRYAYLLAFFALLAGVFVPLITYQISFDAVIQGTATLFLGLTGAILLFKGVTLDKRRGVFIAIGFTLVAISLALIFVLQEHARLY